MNALPPLSADALPDRCDRRIAAFLALALAAVLAFVSFGHVENLDAEMDFQTARGIVLHRDFAVHDDNPAGQKILEGQQSEHFGGSFGRNGKFYSWHGPGRPLLGVPFYLAGMLCESIWPELEERYRAAKSSPESWVTEAAPSELFPRLFFALSSALFGALAAVCVFLSARVLGASRGAALVAALALIFATWFGPATRSALNSVQTAGLLSLGAYGLLRYVQSGAGGDARPLSQIGLFALGLVLGFCVWTRPTEAGAVLVLSTLALLAAARRRRSDRPLRELAAFAAGALLVAAAMLYLNYHRFGRWLEFGHGDAIRHENFVIRDLRLLGLNELFLWLSPGKGALLFAPALLLLVLLWRGRHRRLERAVIALAAAMCFLWPIFSAGWHGGPSYGPRYLTPALPLFAMALAAPAEGFWRRGGWRCALIALLLLAGFAVQLSAFLVSYRTVHELTSVVARREVPMPDDYAATFGAANGITAERWASFDESQRADALRRADRAFDDESRQYYVQVHPAFFPPRVFAAIAWHRLVRPASHELERLERAWIASPYEAPIAASEAERAAWRRPQQLSAEETGLVPSGLEMRGLANLWPIAFATRFDGFPLGWIAGAAAALALFGALGIAITLRRKPAE